MPEYSDIYVLSNKRDKKSIELFFDNFLPNREESADEYEVPQYADSPEHIFKTASELIDYCSDKLDIEHSIYWRASNGSKPEHGMVFFLKDKHVIYGLSTDAADQKYAKALLEVMKELLNSPFGYIAHEASPDVCNAKEFKQQIEIHKP